MSKNDQSQRWGRAESRYTGRAESRPKPRRKPSYAYVFGLDLDHFISHIQCVINNPIWYKPVFYKKMTRTTTSMSCEETFKRKNKFQVQAVCNWKLKIQRIRAPKSL